MTNDALLGVCGRPPHGTMNQKRYTKAHMAKPGQLLCRLLHVYIGFYLNINLGIVYFWVCALNTFGEV